MTAPDAPDPAADDALPGPGPDAGEQMARRLVQDVAAFEVDPPPPARADTDTGTDTDTDTAGS